MYAINHCFASIEIRADDRLHTKAANHKPFIARAWEVTDCDWLAMGVTDRLIAVEVLNCKSMSSASKALVVSMGSGSRSWL